MLLSFSYMCIYQTHPHEQDVIQGHWFKGSLSVLNSVFFFFLAGRHTKFKETSLPYYLSIAGGRMIGLFVPREMQPRPGF